MNGRHEPLRYCVIGDPVAHSLSPVMQTAAFAALALDATYEAIRVPRAEAADAIAKLERAGYAGCNVTTPLKEEVVKLVGELTPAAARAAAVNTIAFRAGRRIGHNTDGDGFLRAAAGLLGRPVAGMRAIVLGSGPAGRAIARALDDAGAAAVFCWSRNPASAAAIGPPAGSTVEIIVSTVPPDATIPPEIVAAVGPHVLAFDVNYGVTASPLAAVAAQIHSDGLPMLLHQGALAFEWWTGLPAPVDAMHSALERAKGRAERPGTQNSPR